MSLEIITIMLAAIIGGMTVGFIIMLRHLLTLYQNRKFHKEVIAMDLDGHQQSLGEFFQYGMNEKGQIQINTISSSGSDNIYTLMVTPGGDWRNMCMDYGAQLIIFTDFERSGENQLYPAFNDDVMCHGVKYKLEELNRILENHQELVNILEREIIQRDGEKNVIIQNMAMERRKFFNAVYNNMNILLDAVDKEFLTAPLYVQEKIRKVREQYIKKENLISENLNSTEFQIKKKDKLLDFQMNKKREESSKDEFSEINDHGRKS